MAEMWANTRDTKVGAVMGTLGMPLRLRATLDEKTGTRFVRIYMGLISLDRKYDTRKLISRTRSGWLQANEPGHAMLNCLRSIENWNMVLDCQNKGTRIELVQVPGTEVWQYVEGDRGLPGIAGQAEVIETQDLKMVAALGLVGLPLLAITGSANHHKYYLPRRGPRRADGLPAVDGMALRDAWWADKKSVPWEDPFAQGARTLFNRERLLDAIRDEKSRVLIRKPRSVRAVLIREDAADEAFDAAKDFLEG